MKAELITGEKVDIDVNVNALTLYNLQNEGVISADFLRSLTTGKPNEVTPDVGAILQAVYAAYRQKNPNGLKFEEFLKQYQFDMETDLEIYFAIISKKARTAFQKGFQQVAGKSKKK
ncbi:hypothetical protein [Lysinibacillus sp. LZ02]|uniref:hypothetical protein n=1 Tax=Lysinibacillus sp. LZ02 TaxID=3420668 RepID=UPI003D3691ED